ncbi:hypothetical protein VTO42DRAFT_3972 [Malbranchea cinnamomea]
MDFEVEEALEVADSIEMIDRQLTETDFDLDIYMSDEYHTNLRMQDTNEGFETAKTQTQNEAEKMTPELQGFSVQASALEFLVRTKASTRANLNDSSRISTSKEPVRHAEWD